MVFQIGLSHSTKNTMDFEILACFYSSYLLTSEKKKHLISTHGLSQASWQLVGTPGNVASLGGTCPAAVVPLDHDLKYMYAQDHSFM